MGWLTSHLLRVTGNGASARTYTVVVDLSENGGSVTTQLPGILDLLEFVTFCPTRFDQTSGAGARPGAPVPTPLLSLRV